MMVGRVSLDFYRGDIFERVYTWAKFYANIPASFYPKPSGNFRLVGIYAVVYWSMRFKAE